MKLLNNKSLLIITRDLFTAFFLLFIIFSVLELIKPKIVLNYINQDLFLVILFLLGISVILFFPQENKKPKKLKFLDYSTIFLLAVLVGILLFYMTRELGIFNILIGLIGFIICYFFMILTYKHI
jgi:peptidoglycan/LPS O-acetylase OafA/YrhL